MALELAFYVVRMEMFLCSSRGHCCGLFCVLLVGCDTPPPSAVNSNGQAAPRTGLFHSFKKQEVCSMK